LNDTLHLTKPEDVNLQQGECLFAKEDGSLFWNVEEIGFLPIFQFMTVHHENNRIVLSRYESQNSEDLFSYLIYDQSELKGTHSAVEYGVDWSVIGYTLID
jgi:hypothetical protein